MINSGLSLFHKPYTLLHSSQLNYQIIFTKFDKVSQDKSESLLKGIEDDYKNITRKIIFSSSKTKVGIKELRREILYLLES